MCKTLIASFLANAERHPDKFCIGYGDERLSYRQVRDRVVIAASQLAAEHSVAIGDFVMISAVARPDYVIGLLAAQYLGATTIPIDRLIARQTFEELVRYVKPKIVLTDAEFDVTGIRAVSLKGLASGVVEGAKFAETAPAKISEPTKVAEILFTTGTTGLPKGAMLSYESIAAITENTRNGVGMREDDIVLIPLPLNHSVGMRVLRTALSIGAGVVIQDGFTFARELEENISKFECTALVSVPTSIEIVRRQMQDRFSQVLGRLRYIEFGAGSLSTPMKRTLLEELPQTLLYNTWGSSETGGVIFLDIRNSPGKLDSLGKLSNDVKFGVLREDGKIWNDAIDRDAAGRMALSGRMRMIGYFNRPEDTADAVRGDWLVTNDLAYIDADGYVFMLGRADDVINVGGEKVAPAEIERVAQEYPGIRECAVVAAADGLMGQVPALFYVMEKGELDRDGFLKFMSEYVERFKFPQRFVELRELPRNRMMKLDRRALKNMINDVRSSVDSVNNETIRTILSRHSVRNFSEREVSRELLETIVRCGIQAPTGHNMQTWRFTVITQRAIIERIKEVLQRKARDYKTVCYGFNNPPVAILVTNDIRNKNGAQDSACAAENMMLAAHSLGLGAVWQNTISYMSEDVEVRGALVDLKVPERHRPWLLLLLGYPQEDNVVPPKRRSDVVHWVTDRT